MKYMVADILREKSKKFFSEKRGLGGVKNFIGKLFYFEGLKIDCYEGYIRMDY